MVKKILFSLTIYLLLCHLSLTAETPPQNNAWPACDLKFSIIKEGELITLPHMLVQDSILSAMTVRGDTNGYKLQTMVSGLDRKSTDITVSVKYFEMEEGNWREISNPVFKIPLSYIEKKIKEQQLKGITAIDPTSNKPNHDASFENENIMINVALMPLTETEFNKAMRK